MGDVLTVRLNPRIVDHSYAAYISTCNWKLHCFNPAVKKNKLRKSKWHLQASSSRPVFDFQPSEGSQQHRQQTKNYNYHDKPNNNTTENTFLFKLVLVGQMNPRLLSYVGNWSFLFPFFIFSFRCDEIPRRVYDRLEFPATIPAYRITTRYRSSTLRTILHFKSP